MTTMIETRRSCNFGFGAVDGMMTNLGAVVDAWIRGVAESHHPEQDLVVGLDCKWRQTMINNRPATLQLCVGSKCIIIQLLHLDRIPSSLTSFLASPNVVCVGVDVNENVKKLKSEYGIKVVRTEDLSDIALYLMPRQFSEYPKLKTLARAVVGLHIPGPEFVTRSDWNGPYLNVVQFEYACLDAYASCMIGMRLLGFS